MAPRAASLIPRESGPRFGRGLTRKTWVFLAAVLLVELVTVLSMNRYGLVMLFAPAVILFFPFFALRVLSSPIQVYCLFLVIIVNLDFFRISDTRLTADILTSSMVLYAVLVRLLLSGGMSLRGPMERTYLLYISVTFLSVVLSVSVPASIKNWGRELEYFVFLLFLTAIPMTEGDRRSVVKAAIFSSLIPCLLGLAGMALGIDAFYGLETPIAGGEAVRRVSATLSHPVVLSNYLAFTGIVTLSLLIDGTWFRRSTLLPLFLLQLSVLYFTYGRTGWIAMAAGVIALFLMRGMRKILFIVLPLLVGGLLVLLPAFLGRILNAFEAGDNSFLWRLGLWAYALSVVPERPFFGSGQDTFITYVAYDTGFAAHNTWINLLVETGVLGLLAFIVLHVTIGVSLRRRRRTSDGGADPLLIGVTSGWIGMLVATFGGDPFNLPAIALYFWSLLALALRPRSSLGTTPAGPPSP